MADCVVLESFDLSDREGNMVKITHGSIVDLRCVDLDVEGSERYSVEERIQRERRILGEGPYVVAWMGQGPCGVTAYVRARDSSGAGIRASELVACN